METIMLILAIVAIIWFFYFFSNREKEPKGEIHSPDGSERKTKIGDKTEYSSRDASALKNNIPGFENPKTTEEQAKIKSQKSLDMLYAESHGMWVCRFCETINDSGARYCGACGAKK